MRTLKNAIEATKASGRPWKGELCELLRNYRVTPHASTGKPPAPVMFNRRLRVKLPEAPLSSKDPASLLRQDSLALDQDLPFNHQAEELCKKLSKRIRLHRRISPYLKRNQREICYCTVIKPVLLYGSTIWTSCSKENLLKLLCLQKRAARNILHAERTASSVSLFNTLKWVLFYAESSVNRCTSTYKRLNGNTPEYINDLLITFTKSKSTRTQIPNAEFKTPTGLSEGLPMLKGLLTS